MLTTKDNPNSYRGENFAEKSDKRRERDVENNDKNERVTVMTDKENDESVKL